MEKRRYDPNRKYMMHCKQCGYEFIWDMNPIYDSIRELQIEYNVIMEKLARFDESERVRTNEKYMAIREKAVKVAAELKDLKEIRMINERASEKGWNDEFKNAVREKLGQEEYEKLVDTVNERMRPYTSKRLMKNWKEE